MIGEDRGQCENDVNGESVFALSEDSPLYRGAKTALQRLLTEDAAHAPV